MKTKKCKNCHFIIGFQGEVINCPPYGLFCSDRCISEYEEMIKGSKKMVEDRKKELQTVR